MAKKALTSSQLRLLVPAGKATPTPPVGPALGQRGVKAIDFCKQFNDRTSQYTPGTPIPVRLTVKPDRTFTFFTKTPPTSFLLKQAAGITVGASKPGQEVVGKVSVKAVYEIAKIKQQDPHLQNLSLEQICRMIAGSARGTGIDIVP
ncbi:mitochondrial 54S ribosomal protein YmL19 [Sorochytrium milnesiophthora]